MATTIMWYFKAPAFEIILTNHATIKRFCLITRYTQYNFSLFEVPCTLICFCFNMVSIIITVFPVCLFPIISYCWPWLIGTMLFTTFNLVCMGLCTNLHVIILGALTYIRLHFVALKTPFPSIGTTNTSTTWPSKAFPIGTSIVDLMYLTIYLFLMAI